MAKAEILRGIGTRRGEGNAMSYTATVLKVMLASPSDVSQEIRMARNIIQEWNDIHAEDRNIVLMAIGWETHSSPEMGDRPQEIINKQVLKDCDLLVAVFWTRLGSPTGSAPSGTVEEIEEHLSSKKPALIYFSSAPVRPDSVDNEQYTALLKFKDSCRKRGLVEDYDDLAAFHGKFARHLAQTIIRTFSSKKPGPGDPVVPPPIVPSLSEAALELLREASKDSSGAIIRVRTMAGTQVETNNREFAERGNARSEAHWWSVVEELSNEGLVEDRSGKGEVFFVTARGYETAELVGQH